MLELFDEPDDGESPRGWSSSSTRKLGLMVEWGLAGDLLLPLLDLLEIKLSLDDRRFLTGPIVVHETSWRNETPSWLFDLARAERFEIVVEKKPGMVGPAELTAVMYGAMLEQPRPHATVELYLWAATSASARHYNRDAAGIWKSLDHAPIEDQEVIERGGRLWHEYQPLAEAIRRKVIAEKADREHEEERDARMNAQYAESRASIRALADQARRERLERERPAVTQPTLFGEAK